MTDPALTPGPDGAPTWLTQALALIPWLIAGLGIIIAAGRKALGGAFDGVTEWFAGFRRVAETKRDGVIEAMQEQIDRLTRIVESLQDQLNESDAKIDALTHDLTEHRSYGWESYGEIRRLDPDTKWPRPPRERVQHALEQAHSWADE